MRICCRLRRADCIWSAKKCLEWCWNGYFDEIVQSCDCQLRQWRSADAWRGNGACQRIGYILDCESFRKHASSIVDRKVFCDEKRVFLTNGFNGPKTTSHYKTGFGLLCTTENFVPIVFPGLLSSSSASSSTSGTPSRQESHCSSSSTSSSSSPTVSEVQTREREDQIESDISPVHVSTTVDDRSGWPDDNQASKNPKTNKKETPIERSNPSDSEIPE